MADTKNGVTFYTDETGVRQAFPTVLIDAVARAVVSAQMQSATAPLDYQQITNADLNTVQHLVPPDGAKRAMVQNNGGSSVRWLQGDDEPARDIGIRLDTGESWTFGGDLAAVSFIDEGNNAELDVAYYG